MGYGRPALRKPPKSGFRAIYWSSDVARWSGTDANRPERNQWLPSWWAQVSAHQKSWRLRSSVPNNPFFFFFKARTLFGDGWRWIIGGTHGADWPWKGRNQTRWVLSDRNPVASCFTTHVERRAPYLVPALNRLFEQCLAKWLWLRPTTNRPF